MLILAALGLLGLFFKVKNFRKPYKYSSFVLSLYRDFTFVLLLLIFLLEKVLDVVTYSLLIIPFFLTPFIIYACQELMIIIARRRNLSDISDVEEAEGYIYLLLSTAKKILSHREDLLSAVTNKGDSNINQCYLLSVLNLHTRHCESANCVCKSISGRQTLKKRKQIYRNDWLSFVKQQLGEVIQKNPKEPRFLLFLACIEYYYFNNFFLALNALKKAEALDLPIVDIIMFKYAYREIELSMINNQLPFLENTSGRQGLLDVRRLTTSMKLCNRFLERAEDYITACISFWNILLSDVPNTLRINYIGVTIFECMKEINQLYNKVMEVDPNNADFLQKYGDFLNNVMFDEMSAEKVLERIRILTEKNELNRLFHSKFGNRRDKLLILKASGKFNSLGKIQDVNLVAIKKLKYERNEILRLTANQLLPSNLSDVHDKWIMASYENLIDPCEVSLLHGFIKDKYGYFIVCSLLIRLIPNLKDELSFLIAIQLNKKFTGYVQATDKTSNDPKNTCLFLCDENNKIIGINKVASEWINMGSNEINGKYEMTMENFISELKTPNIEALLTSNNGYDCEVKRKHTNTQLEDFSPKYKEDVKEEKEEVSPAWVRLFKEVNGKKTGILVNSRVFVIIPSNTTKSGTFLV